MSKKTLGILMALVLITLPMFLSINTAYAALSENDIPNRHQYRFASIGLPESLDPSWAYDTSSGELMLQVYEPLVQYKFEEIDVLRPVLAESLPTLEKVTKTLTIATVDLSNPVGTDWVSGGVTCNLFGWRDEDASTALNVNDLVWFENTADHEKSFHGAVTSLSGAGPVTMTVYTVRHVFKIRENVHFHAWTSDIPGYAAHTADLLTTEDAEFSFERGFVLDHVGGPMGLVMTPTLGIMTTTQYNLPADAALVGHMIDNAFQHNGTHFWIDLLREHGAFLKILTQSWAFIHSKAHDIALQELYLPVEERWTGFGTPPDYDNWLGFTNPAEGFDEIDMGPGHMCGTGPYKFDYLTEEVRWHISKFDGYWGGAIPEGRSPDDYIDTAMLEYYEDPSLAFVNFLSDNPADQYDSVYVPRMYRDELIDEPGVRTYAGFKQLVSTNFMMGYDPEETSIYLPKMPPDTTKHDLFSDIHMRKAFAHLVNHTEYIATAHLNEAQWPNTLLIEGLKYHNPDRVPYDYSLTEALREFKLAWGGTELIPGPAFTEGFKVKLLWNTGNTMRQKFCEMMEYSLEQDMLGMWPSGINTDCIEVIGLSWRTVILPALNTFQLGSWCIGWAADYPDPDNFATPFIHSLGDYSRFQRVQYGQSGMKQQAWDLTPFNLGTFGNPALTIDNDYVDTLIEKAVWIDDSSSAGYNMREAMYYHLQDIHYEECASYTIYQPLGRRWERDWVQGWYHNLLNPYTEGPGAHYYYMWKGWIVPGDLDFKKDTLNGDASLNFETCDYLDLFKFRGYYLMPTYMTGNRMRYADFNCDKQVDYLDLGRFRSYYVYYPQWTLNEGVCHYPSLPPH